MDKLIAALIQVESNGKDDAIGDKHLADNAYGPLQIRQPALDDVNERWGTKHKAAEMLNNRDLSIKVFKEYMARYATEARLGRPVTDEDRARIWNGGPNGYKSSSTVGYWGKVSKLLK